MINEVYNDIFDPEYLIKYGYFSYKKNKDKESQDENYFSTETFYKMFNLSSFSKIASSLLPSSYDFTPTEPIYFNIPKKGLTRRQYKLPNLYSYVNLVSFMCDNKAQFTDVFLENKFSISKFFDSPKYKFPVTEEIKSKLLFSGQKLLHLDLSNFYHTLYTHSIPWMLMGKASAKANHNTGFANELDKLIEACQYGETHGIPTGNLASRIVAELFMCHFDKKLEDEGFKYARYVDDFTFSYSIDSEKDKFVEQVNLLCREYNLYLNSEKTLIEEFPQNNTRSKSEIFNFFESRDFLKKPLKTQQELINAYIDLCVTEESKGNKGALKIIFSGLQRTIVFQGNLSEDRINGLFLDINSKSEFSLLEKIIDISIKKPELTNRFMDLFENLFTTSKIRRLAKQRIQKYFEENKELLKSRLLYYKRNNFSQELYQILLYIVQFDIRTQGILTRQEILSMMDERVDDLSLCLLVIIYLKRKLSIDKLLSSINTLLTEVSNNNSNQSRFSGKLWYLRYFIYYLIENGMIDRRAVNRFCQSQGFTSNRNGYKSELNSKYIFSQGNQTRVNNFYETLLQLNVGLVDCGKNNKFKYFN
ncbi:TPA: RNA-directed DNA polymerase [Streptococcus suis]|nr:RNA-directed DNA polymerase [Streptococcus suis]HEM6237749.1 RNA-directed DNA polymerase [Streptococcus suis]